MIRQSDLCTAVVLLCWTVLPARGQIEYEHAPIHYMKAEVHDRVAQLNQDIQAGKVTLDYDEQYGYLKSVLSVLDIPVSSQGLVFSKTSLQVNRISPRRPRALYFNDDVYVGYCQQGEVLELSAVDAKQGAMFYSLSQKKQQLPKFVRDKGSCLVCHSSHRTQDVPGYLVRSVFPDVTGRPKFGNGTFTSDHTRPFKERWGGWYVSGQHGSMRHMGNTICITDETTFDRELGANDLDLSDNLQIEPYLTPHSDIVALMVLDHQTQMHNAITAAGYETRQAIYQSHKMNKLLDRPSDYLSDSAKRRIAASAERVLKYLLFCDEFTLTDTVIGSTTFAQEFTARGKQDSSGRSLREFDLQTRLFKYPCSYVIYSEAFANLPDEVRQLVWSRLVDILTEIDQSPKYAHLTSDIRTSLLQILQETHPEFQQFLISE